MKKGFTLVEVILVLGILAILGGVTVLGSSTAYRRQLAESERDLVLSLLWRARGRALANMGQADHGLFVASSSYVLFQGDSYATRDPDLDESFPRNQSLTLGGADEIVFSSPDAVHGAASGIMVGNQATSYTININVEGKVDWQ